MPRMLIELKLETIEKYRSIAAETGAAIGG
jgi:hypothetical protein